MLELKESKSDYWLIGLNKNDKLIDSKDTNIKCYTKNTKKQTELANKMLEDNSNVNEVYSLPDYAWNNIPKNAMEATSYIHNKGKCILSRDNLETKTEEDEIEHDPILVLDTIDDNEQSTNEIIPEISMVSIINELRNIENDWNILQNIINKFEIINEYTFRLVTALFDEYKTEEATPIDVANKILKIIDVQDTNIKEEKLKESLTSTIGLSQMANSFTNIDVDANSVEVSEYITHLSQAIRSEQQAILEYAKLRMTNGSTNEDKIVIDAILNEEKDHMTALVSLLYKQILAHYPTNLDSAKSEFTLPSFGLDDKAIPDDKELKEAMDKINPILDKFINKSLNEDVNIINASSTMSQEQYNIQIDVTYDADFQTQVVNNLIEASKKFNDENLKNKKGYGIDTESIQLNGNVLEFILITLDGIFTENITTEFVTSVANLLFELASTYEYFIALA